MAKTDKTENKPTHEQIARRAYQLFEQSGRIPGRDLENWLAAETQLNGSHKNGAATQAASATKAPARPASQETGQRRI